MWTLILTITISTGSWDGGVSVSIHHIDGFKKQERCKEAGKSWLDNANSHSKTSKSALCVRKSL